MRVRITTHFSCTEEELWEKIIQPASLQFVASPVLSFKPLDENALPDEWQVDTPYRLRLQFLGFIPLGEHTIRLAEMNRETNTIHSRESGQLATVWNHDISFRETEPGTVRYTDEIEIRAGWLTPAVALFAHLFYRHRQRRWKVLLNRVNSDGA